MSDPDPHEKCEETVEALEKLIDDLTEENEQLRSKQKGKKKK